MTNQDSETIDFYDRSYRGTTLDTVPPIEPVVLELDGYLRPGDRVLEIGGGVGRNILPIGRKGHTVTSVDTSAEGNARLLEFARQLGTDKFVTAVLGDALAGLPDGPWDAIIMAKVLHEFHYSDAVSLVAQAQALTGPGGYHALAVPIIPIPPSHLAEHFVPSDPDEVTALYTDAGWEALDTFSTYSCCSFMFCGIWRKPPA